MTPEQTPEDPVMRAIRELASSDIKQLNRIAACEALLYSLLERIDPQALAGLAEAYDQALLRTAEQLPPSIQRPELWQGFAQAISDQQAVAAPPSPPPAGKG